METYQDEETGPRPPDRSAIEDHMWRPHFNWHAIASSMVARRAYRRYHGPHQLSLRFENGGTLLTLLLLWGFYQFRVGTLQSLFPKHQAGRETALERSGNEAGFVVTFVWAYTDSTEFWGTVAGGGVAVLVAYILIRYQRALQLKYAAWVTIATCLVMLGLAIMAGLRDSYSDKNLATRANVVWIWIIIQAFFIACGGFRKRMLPWLHQGGNLLALQLRKSSLQLGAVEEGFEDMWQKLPHLRERLLLEYKSSPLFSFSGEYSQYGGRLLEPCGFDSRETVKYVGGLDTEGVPHGLGVWHDSYAHGELLIGRFMHGIPVAPFRVRTNGDSGFAAFRIALLSCRTDAVASLGSLQGAVGPTRVVGGSRRAPLRAGVASVECNTSGLFYKGFPRVVWLQEPTAIKNQAYSNRNSRDILPGLGESMHERAQNLAPADVLHSPHLQPGQNVPGQEPSLPEATEVSIPIVSGPTHRYAEPQPQPQAESADVACDSGSTGSHFDTCADTPVATQSHMHGMHDAQDMQSSRVSGEQQTRRRSRRRLGMEGSAVVGGVSESTTRVVGSSTVASLWEVGQVHPGSPSYSALPASHSVYLADSVLLWISCVCHFLPGCCGPALSNIFYSDRVIASREP